MSDFRVTGADSFLKLSKALKAAGETDLRKELHKGLQQGAKPLIPLTKAAAREQLPQRGGLSKKVAAAPQRVQVRTGKTAGVRLVVSKRAGARAANRGELRHPVFARGSQTRDEWTWVTQKVQGGWFDDTIGKHVVDIVPNLENALQRVVDDIVRRAR